MTALQDATDSLFAAFADIPKPRSIDACPCCVEEKNLCNLLSVPLREISPDDLGSYASSAFLTAGDVPDYLYFLPRILEISVTTDYWWPDPEVTGRAVNNTLPLTWQESRLDALLDLFRCLIDQLLLSENSGPDLDSWICGIARMGLDVRPYLAQIELSPDHVTAYYEENSKRLAQRKLSNSFWERPNAGYDQVVDWFGTESVGDIILAAYGIALYHNSEQNAAEQPATAPQSKSK